MSWITSAWKRWDPTSAAARPGTAPSYLAGVGASGTLLAASMLVFVMLVVGVSFDSWPKQGGPSGAVVSVPSTQAVPPLASADGQLASLSIGAPGGGFAGEPGGGADGGDGISGTGGLGFGGAPESPGGGAPGGGNGGGGDEGGGGDGGGNGGGQPADDDPDEPPGDDDGGSGPNPGGGDDDDDDDDHGHGHGNGHGGHHGGGHGRGKRGR